MIVVIIKKYVFKFFGWYMNIGFYGVVIDRFNLILGFYYDNL